MSSSITTLLEEAGAIGHVVLLLSAVGAVLAVVMLGLTVPRRAARAAVLAAGAVLGLGLAAVLLGAAGQQASLVRAFDAIAHAPPDERPELVERSEAEARSSRTLGLLGGGPLVALAAAALSVTFLRNPRRTS